jgi:hypothetical protein
MRGSPDKLKQEGKSMRGSRTIAATSLTVLIVLTVLFLGACNTDPNQPEGQEEMKLHTAEPAETEGAPYPPARPSERIPNEEEVIIPVPTGPKVGDMEPANPAVRIQEVDTTDVDIQDGEGGGRGGGSGGGPGMQAALRFLDYAELTNSIPATSLCCPEPSVAQNGQTIMLTGNVWMALSEDGGSTFSNINPTTIFPESDGGLCCDQVVTYVPQIDMFIWLMQYWDSGGQNRLRMAAQTTDKVRSSNGTAWTYWDFISTVFNPSGRLDYNDMSFGESSLWWSSQIIGGGRIVTRIPLSQIAAKGTITYSYTGETDALWSHVSHNANDTVYWAGHVDNSELRVYSMRDGDSYYSWRSVTVNSWPNGTNSSLAPDGTDWLTFESWKHYVYGNAVQRESVWFGWLAAAEGGFPQPHIQLVRINTSTWTLQEQVQIWNPDIAFLDPYLSTNSRGEIGMSVGFGGGGFYPSHAVGVWGDFVVYYPRLSTRATQRWGNYNTCRRSGSDGMEWVAGGYTMETDGTGANIMRPHYIRFGR